jgi:hypothetical protein
MLQPGGSYGKTSPLCLVLSFRQLYHWLRNSEMTGLVEKETYMSMSCCDKARYGINEDKDKTRQELWA